MITPRQFVRACLLFRELSPGQVAKLFKPGTLPKRKAIAQDALALVDELRPSESTLPTHARVCLVAEWAGGAR